jgi:hypothetical protein
MRARRLRLVFETGELSGVGGVTITSELVVYSDGTVTGQGVLVTGDAELAFAATGELVESLATNEKAS